MKSVRESVVNLAKVLVVSLVSYGILCLSLSLMFIPAHAGTQSAAAVLAVMFWLGLAAGTAAVCVFTVRMKSIGRAVDRIRKTVGTKHRPGIVSFRKRPLSLILYAVIAAGITVIAVETLYPCMPDIVVFPVIGLTVAAFILHCIVDGWSFEAFVFVQKIIKKEMVER